MKSISKTKRAFTLVELLVVITIIALLAALTVGLYSRVKGKTVESAILAEMEQVKLALQSYKEKHGNFPPSGPAGNNRLYYYLSGEAELMRSPDLTDLTQLHSMDPGEIKKRRMKDGIKNLLPNLKPPVCQHPDCDDFDTQGQCVDPVAHGASGLHSGGNMTSWATLSRRCLIKMTRRRELSGFMR
jgi:prepilin-type N-terminal cleavage/methylation domain-containing protein